MRLGQPYPLFWEITLAEFVLIAEAVQKRERDRFERDQALNWQLAQLVGVAINDPKKFPKLKDLRAEEPPEEMTEEQGANRMRAAFLGLVAASDRQRRT